MNPADIEWVASCSLEHHHTAEAEHLMSLFSFTHLPPHLQAVSGPFAELAAKVFALPVGFERTAALRRLLEAKDCAVRTLIGKKP